MTLPSKISHMVFFILILISVNCVYSTTVSVIAPAVAETEYGYNGTALQIDITLTKGSGHVFMDTFPISQMDMQSSARMATKVAFDVCNKNQNEYDTYFVVRSDVPVVGGPSAGGLMCVAIISALNNWTLKKDVMMTGMINPDGSIGPVGGIVKKLEAAKALNMKYFLIPKGEENTTELGTNKTINVVEYGKKLGIKVIPVRDINECIYYFTGHKIEEKNYKPNPIKERIYKSMMKSMYVRVSHKLNSEYSDVLKKLDYLTYNPYNNSCTVNFSTNYYYDNYNNNDNINNINNYINNISKNNNNNYDGGNPNNVNINVIFSNRIKDIKNSINESKKLYNNGSYYAATSKLFGALISLEYINTTCNYLSSKNKKEYVKNYLKSIETNIELNKEIINSNKLTINNFEYLISSKSRIYEAEDNLNLGWECYNKSDYMGALYYGSYAKLRSLSAIWWLDLYRSSPSEGFSTSNRPLDEYSLKYLAREYLDNTEIVVLYTKLVFPNELVFTAENYLDDAKKYYYEGEYLLSISKSIDSYVYATTPLALMEDKEYLKKMARQKINKAESYNDLIPVSALGYYEYANSFNNSFAILYYKYSASYAQMDIDIIKEITTKRAQYNSFAVRGIGYESNNYKENKLKDLAIYISLLLIGMIVGIFVGRQTKVK